MLMLLTPDVFMIYIKIVNFTFVSSCSGLGYFCINFMVVSAILYI